MANLAGAEAAKIINSIDGLPPNGWLLQCRTNDQVRHWEWLKGLFTGLHDELKAYFSGHKALSTNGRDETLFLLRDFYLALYYCLQIAWDEIKEIAEREQISNFNPQTPGECLIEILNEKCLTLFEYCQVDYEEWSVRKLHETNRLSNKYVSFAERPREQWTEKEREIAEKYLSLVGKSDYSMIDFCLVALKEIVQKKKNSKLHKILSPKHKELWKKYWELKSLLASKMHPSKRLRGGSWVNGEWLEVNPRGRTYGKPR